MPLMLLDPPRVRPCVVAMARPAVSAVGSVRNCQVQDGSNSVLVNPAGICIQGLRSGGPASSTHTVTAGSSVSRWASTDPAAPAPTIT